MLPGDNGSTSTPGRYLSRQGRQLMSPLELVKLIALMQRSNGSPDVRIGLIDGPVLTQHPDLARDNIRELRGNNGATSNEANNTARLHGTFVAGILSAKRESAAPAICPNCTLLVYPIFAERLPGSERVPSATVLELAAAIKECIEAGARVINLSLALTQMSLKAEQALEEALNQAAGRGVIVVAAAGNQGTLGSSAITRHPWVIPVVGCDLRGLPSNESNLGSSIGRRGLRAPGDAIISLGSEGESNAFRGSSVAVPFVTGAIALLWSEFPAEAAAQIKLAISQNGAQRRATVVPPLLDATAAYQYLATKNRR
jgi:subtilisin family serine protease